MIDRPGIYIIKNLINNHIYIGSAQKSFKRRWTQHYSDLKLDKHRNIHLQRAFNKYGAENFVFIILELVEINKCIEIEQFYIDNLKPQYNIDLIAGSRLGYKWTPEQMKKHPSIHMKGKIPWNKGLPFSEEVRKKMSIAKKGKPGHMLGKKLRKYKPIQRSDGKIYRCVTDCSLNLNVKENTVIKACTDKKKIRTVRGFTLKYL